ncbi:prolyl oligopeptidase family serine peptidase [Thalassotalea sp. PLHSN55]|uniref:S9 family peptidase n=1 Tax=Thalassotalea sp. PLHSN55 TaxID=3435888 RepID=UPI003F830A4F
MIKNTFVKQAKSAALIAASLACLPAAAFNAAADNGALVANQLPTIQSAFTVEKLNELNQLHNVKVSPKGDIIVYGLKMGSSSTDNHLYAQNLKSGEVTQLTSHAKGEGNVAFSQSGDSIYFLSSRSGSSQVWQLPLTGGEAMQMTNLPLAVNGFVISPSGKKLALELSVKNGCKTFECTLEARKADEAKKHQVRTYDQLMVRHWDHWLDEYNEHLFVADVPEKISAATQITTATDIVANWHGDIAGISQVAFHPEDTKLAFSAKAPAKDHAWTTNFDIFEVNLKDNSFENITKENLAWDAKPLYSSNGRYLAYLAMKTPGYESDKFSINIKDNHTGQTKLVAGSWDRSVSSMIFSPNNRSLFVTAQDVGQKSVFEVHPEFGDVRKVYSDGSVADLAVHGEQLYFTRHSLNSPKDIFTIHRDGSALQQLTQVNKDKLANINFADFEQFNFKGWNDETVHGYLLKPANFEAGKKYPMAFLVHGGPQGSFGNMFHYRWNAQLWAAQGYGVVMVDFHGSTGYGQAFTDSIAGDWGGKPLEDLQKGFAHIVEQEKWLDEDRSCALGASYGGYMMNWIAGNWPDGFNCLVNHAGLFDMPSFYGTTEELWFPEHDLGGPVWSQARDDYNKFNPSAFVTNWKTPMLVIQGELDYRVPYAQSLGAFTSLQRQGIDSRLVMFPSEDHHIRNPDNLVVWYQEVFKWINKYTKAQ